MEAPDREIIIRTHRRERDLVGSRSFEAFGTARATSGASSIFGFMGESTDSTGLVYCEPSVDPVTGRMLYADTVIPNAQGTQSYNLYANVANNPRSFADPTGHVATSSSELNLALAPAVLLSARPKSCRLTLEEDFRVTT